MKIFTKRGTATVGVLTVCRLLVYTDPIVRQLLTKVTTLAMPPRPCVVAVPARETAAKLGGLCGYAGNESEK